MASTAVHSYYKPECIEGKASEPAVLAIEKRKAGCRFLYRVEGATIFHYSQRQATEYFEVYGQ